MNIECPKCGFVTKMSDEELAKVNHTITCPRCMSTLKIVDNVAYIPTEKAPLEELKPYQPEPPQFKGEEYYHNQQIAQGLDPLYLAAVDYVKTCDALTLPMLQRYFEIPPERAETLMQQLEDNKVVAPFDGIHPRKILIEHNTNIKSVYWQQQRRYSQESQQPDPQQPLAPGETGEMPRSRQCSCSLPGCGVIIFVLLLIYLIIQFFR